MKQILQNLKTGATEVADVPCPAVQPGQLLIQSARTLVSVGTERMLVNFSQASLLGKAKAQPDKVRQVFDKIGTDGLVSTLEAVFNKLDQPLPLGYCNVGRVMEVGRGVTGYAVGDRVVSNGKHAEVVSVAKNLCSKVPDNVSDDEAAFTVLAAVGLQGIRLAQPSLGEAVVVTGLGVVGLLTVLLLRAQGCRVLALDFDATRLALARQFGAEVVDLSANPSPIAAAQTFSRGRGVDAVLITASTTSNAPMHQAALMCRKRGRIVLVGATGLELSRTDFYEKELTFQVSCSYGPGRHDKSYEENGVDYPVGFVRWTEQRNFEAVLDMMADGRLDVEPLISHRFSIDQAPAAYALLSGDVPALGVLFEYVAHDEASQVSLRRGTTRPDVGSRHAATDGSRQVSLAFLGAGNYATAVLIPAFKSAGARLRVVGSRAGVSGVHAQRKFGFEAATTDSASVFADVEVNTVVIATRHDSHAELVIAAVRAGKHVFVEKPLALTLDELDRVDAEVRRTAEASLLMVGFNRRFAPQVARMKALLTTVVEPKVLVMTVNAGAMPADHWAQDPAVGGGRIIGEACHFIDLLRFLTGSSISSVHATSLGRSASSAATDDKATITLRFGDGSLGTILYLANGHRSFPKERLEVFTAGRILQLENFRKLNGFGWPGFSSMKLWRQDKGQRHCAAAFVHAVEHATPSPIALDEIIEVSRVSIEAAEMLR